MDDSTKSEVVVTQQRQIVNNNTRKERPTAAGLGITTTKPKFPEYAQVAKRQESYFQQEVIWLSNNPVSVDALVAAGLVFTGVGDSVRCYYCGGGMRNLGPADDPMVEHARWYPNCPHVNLVKGKDFVNRIADGLPPEPEVPSAEQNTVPKTVPNNILETDASQAVIQMGYSPENVLKAIHIFKCRKGLQHCKGSNLFLHFTGRELCEILMEMEENPRLYNQYDDGSNSSDSTVSGGQPSVEQAKALEQEEVSLVDIDENRKLKMKLVCKVCFAAMADIVFTSCGHMLCCGQCAPSINVCFLCDKTVEGLVKALWGS